MGGEGVELMLGCLGGYGCMGCGGGLYFSDRDYNYCNLIRLMRVCNGKLS